MEEAFTDKYENEGYKGSVEKKIHHIASQFTDCAYSFADFAQANVAFDHIDKPTIMYVLPASGKLHFHYNRVFDRPEVQLWFLCPADFDFDGRENECRVEAMKRLAIRFIDAVNNSGLFHPVDVADIPYQVAYDAFDINLTGICLTPQLEEKEGVTLCTGQYQRGWNNF